MGLWGCGTDFRGEGLRTHYGPSEGGVAKCSAGDPASGFFETQTANSKRDPYPQIFQSTFASRKG